MKKISLLLGLLVIGSVAFSQQLDPKDFQKPELTLRKSQEASIPNTTPIRKNSSRAGGDLIWSESFNGAASFSDWVKTLNSGPGNGFVWSTTGPVGPFSDPSEIIASTTASNGFIILRSDSANDNGSGGSNGSAIDATASDTVNIPAGVNGVFITLEQTFRYFVADQNANYGLEMWIYDDANDTIIGYDLIGEVSINSGSANPIDGDKYYVPTANSSFIKIEFRQYNISNYHWQIDDIKVYEAHNIDLSIENVYLKGFGPQENIDIPNTLNPVYRSDFYSDVPRNQSANISLSPAVTYKNNGITTPDTVVSTVNFQGNGVSYSDQSISVTPAISGGNDTISTTTPITSGGSALLNYQINTSISGGTDGASADNTSSIVFTNTANTYAWDRIPAQRIRNFEQDDLIGVAYEAFADDTIIGVEVGFFDPSSSSSVGTFVTAFIYKYSDIINHLDSRINGGNANGSPVSPLATIPSSLSYQLTANDIGGYKRLITFEELPMVAGETYVAAIKNSGGANLWIAFDNGVTPSPWSIFQNDETSFTGNDGRWFTETIIPHVRLITKNIQACASTVISANGTPVYDFDNYTGGVQLSPTGGAQPYSFSWTGPDQFESNDQDITGLATIGTYTVTIVDGNGCTTTESFEVQGNIGINNVTNPMNVKVYPNPSNGNFKVGFNNEPGNYEVNLVNAIGQTVATRLVNVSGSGDVIEFSNLDLAAGVYSISVKNTENTSTASVVKVVIE